MATLWKRLLACIFTTLAITGWASDAPEPPPSKSALEVMSFNIRYGSANDGANRWPLRKDLVFATINKHDPDIVGLQEALRFQIDAIRKALPHYAESGVGRDDGKTKGEYSALLYRTDRLELLQEGTFWFSDTPEKVASTHWGNSIPRICSWAYFKDKTTGQTFYAYNVHLDHRSANSRLKSAELLAARIAARDPKAPAIVTGDFNAGETSPPITFLLQKAGLVDTFRTLHPDAKAVGTFNGFNGRTNGAKINYVLTTPGVKAEASAILHDHDDKRWPSDHMPVTARIVLPKN